MSDYTPPARREPAIVFPPGDYIREELCERGWNRQRFGGEMGMPRKEVLNLLRGVTPVTPEVAEDLSRVFGTSATMWLNLEAAWQAGTEAAKARYCEGKERETDV